MDAPLTRVGMFRVPGARHSVRPFAESCDLGSNVRMTSQIPLDRRLYGIAQQLLIAMVSGREPEPGPRRDVVSEQDAVDATLLLLAAIQEQLQANRIRTDAANRMIALLMLIRDYVRPLPPGLAADGTDRLTSDLTEIAEVVRLSLPARGLPSTDTP